MQGGGLVESPTSLASILGAQHDGSLNVELCEIGANGYYPIGTVVIKRDDGKIVVAVNAEVARLYGVVVDERWVIDIASERNPSIPVARKGSFKATMLRVADGSSLAVMASRLRELGIYLEGLAASVAPPFRIRYINPDRSLPDALNVVLTVNLDGSITETPAPVVIFGDVDLPTVWLDSFTLRGTIAAVPSNEGTVLVKVRAGTAGAVESNSVKFEIRGPGNP